MGIWASAFDRLTLGCFRLLSGRLSKRLVDAQFTENQKNWKRDPAAFIEDQPRLTGILYGKAGALARRLFFRGRPISAAENACEVIAVYNALLSLNSPESFPELLKQFSERGICFNGIFGTSPKAVERFLKRKGYALRVLKGREITEEALSKLSESCRCFIFTAFNRGQNPFHMVHTMCITKEAGSFIVHNDNGSRRAKSLSEAVLSYHGGAGHAICLIAIF